MNNALILSIIAAYFLMLMVIGWFTARKAANIDFFLGGRNSNWMLVSFGMIGASLSGVTFLSIPGSVGTGSFGYMQMVFGYLAGYIVVAYVLMPIYYKMNLTSIYQYLNQRFGVTAYKTGALFFLVSRSLGSAIRLMLVAAVLQYVLLDNLGVPFWVTAAGSLILILLYTFKGGIKTIVVTDTLQTAFMLISLFLTIGLVFSWLDTEMSLPEFTLKQPAAQILFTDNLNSGAYFWKQFIGGMFIAIGMTGLDQDMMQKNLSCRTLKDAQKNMMTFSVVLVIVNLGFLILGLLLYAYVNSGNAAVPVVDGSPRPDLLFASIALSPEAGVATGILFLLGLIAAAYSSADSALTALTTSFCVDILNIDKKSEKSQIQWRKRVHLAVTVIIFILIIVLNKYLNISAIGQVIFFAGFTYGPLIGLFFFGILTRRKVNGTFAATVMLLVTTLLIIWYTLPNGGKLGDYSISAELIVINAAIVFALLYLGSWFTPQYKAEQLNGG
jgi:Na+/proline symporter